MSTSLETWTLRDAVLTDAPRIAAFNQALAQETEDKVLPLEIVLPGVERGLQKPQYCRYFVAEVGATVIGQTMITYEWSDWRDGLLWWIQSVYVAPEWRGRGVFSSLYQHVERLARAEVDVRGIRLYMEDHNETARRTYLRLGMVDARYSVFETMF